MAKDLFIAAVFLLWGGVYFATPKTYYNPLVGYYTGRYTNAAWLCFFASLVCVCVGLSVLH